MNPDAGPPSADAVRPIPRRILTLLALLLLAGVLARLYRIDAQLFEYRHYRPMDTAALARNFHEGRLNILYPQVDWRGTSTGYAEAEFQVYAFTVALLYRVFGEHLWVGRAVNVMAWLGSALMLFFLVRRLYDDLAGLGAVAVLAVAPLPLFFSRTVQADGLVACCVLAGVWFMVLWAERRERWWALGLSLLGVVIAALVKPPYLYVGLPLVYVLHRRVGWRFLRSPVLWCYALLCIAPVVAWYAWALSLWEAHGNTFGILGKRTVLEAWGLFDPQWLELGERLVERVTFKQATPAGLVLLGAGVVQSVRARRGGVLAAWAAGFAVYLLAVPRGNLGHDYYQLHLAFLVAAFMGVGASWMWRRGRGWRALLALVAVAGLASSALELRKMMRPRHWLFARQEFCERVRAASEPEDLVVFVIRREWEPISPEDYRHHTKEGEMLYSDPRDFFLSHRKGFSLDDVQATPEFVEELRRRGVRFFATAEPYGPLVPSGNDGVFDRFPELREALDARYTAIEVGQGGAIYELTEPPEGSL